MQHIIRNTWEALCGTEMEQAVILTPSRSPERFFVTRYRWNGPSEWQLPPNGCFVSVIAGHGQLLLKTEGDDLLSLVTGCHVYHPAWNGSIFRADKGTEVVCVAAPTKKQASGNRLILRDEEFLSSVTTSKGMLRWKLTPQYLSRRVFLHHDKTLLSGSGWPVSWFHTTMFDVSGLPKNDDGEPVFKMSYNYRSEFNICIDVRGSARVRMARHPYNFAEGDIVPDQQHRAVAENCHVNSEATTATTETVERKKEVIKEKRRQAWDDWEPIDGQTTYHLNEAAGSDLEERFVNPKLERAECFRNKHEVSICNGYVSLLCMFDPAPTGMELHQPGSYSSYGPLHAVLGTQKHNDYLQQLRDLDDMVDKLSLSKARGTISADHKSAEWDLHQAGVRAQANLEHKLHESMKEIGRGHVIADWATYTSLCSSSSSSSSS